MSDTDLMQLYSGKILDLTTRIPHLGRLEAPQGSAKRRSPLCGSSVSAQVVLTEGRVSAFAQEVRACALGQAAAAITGAAVMGRSPAELQAAAEALAAMLEGGPVPPAPFDGFEVLTPAREFKNRHASIRLALEAATEAALDAAKP